MTLTAFVSLVGGLGAFAGQLMADSEWPVVVEAGVIAVGVSLVWMPLGWPEVKELFPNLANRITKPFT